MIGQKKTLFWVLAINSAWHTFGASGISGAPSEGLLALLKNILTLLEVLLTHRQKLEMPAF